MIKETDAIVEAMSKLELSDMEMKKPIQDLFDECLNFISVSSFDI